MNQTSATEARELEIERLDLTDHSSSLAFLPAFRGTPSAQLSESLVRDRWSERTIQTLKGGYTKSGFVRILNRLLGQTNDTEASQQLEFEFQLLPIAAISVLIMVAI